jgi:hypothetical protein
MRRCSELPGTEPFGELIQHEPATHTVAKSSFVRRNGRGDPAEPIAESSRASQATQSALAVDRARLSRREFSRFGSLVVDASRRAGSTAAARSGRGIDVPAAIRCKRSRAYGHGRNCACASRQAESAAISCERARARGAGATARYPPEPAPEPPRHRLDRHPARSRSRPHPAGSPQPSSPIRSDALIDL